MILLNCYSYRPTVSVINMVWPDLAWPGLAWPDVIIQMCKYCCFCLYYLILRCVEQLTTDTQRILDLKIRLGFERFSFTVSIFSGRCSTKNAL